MMWSSIAQWAEEAAYLTTLRTSEPSKFTQVKARMRVIFCSVLFFRVTRIKPKKFNTLVKKTNKTYVLVALSFINKLPL